jgi:hypothetical protein
MKKRKFTIAYPKKPYTIHHITHPVGRSLSPASNGAGYCSSLRFAPSGSRNTTQVIPTEKETPIECSGGIQIIDFSPELGDAGIEIHNCPAFYLKKGLRLESRSRILGPALTGVIC